MGIPASRRSAMVFRRTCHTVGDAGGLGLIEPSISWELVAFSAPLELANGVEAQPAPIDATMINNVPRIIKADFLSGDIGTPPWCAAQQLRAFYCQTPSWRIVKRWRLTAGHDNIVARYAKTFKDGDFLFGLRIPQRIDVATGGGSDAAEVGVWKWKRRHLGQEITWTGRYLAMWQKVDGHWGLRSDLYVTTGCTGACR